MKRVALIIAMLVLLIVGFISTTYMVRKSKIKEQYVSSMSTSVLSFAVDDLLLDNISNVLPWNSKQLKTKQSNSWIKRLLFDAGISIPARIHLFAMPSQKTAFYGILKLKNYDDCFSFFANLYPEGIDFVDKEKGIVSVVINKNINLLFDYDNIVYKITTAGNTDFKDLQTLLQEKDKWVQIGSFEGFEDALSKKHIAYHEKDAAFKLEATITHTHTEIEGKWLMNEDLTTDFQIRDIDTTQQILTFWNVLPRQEVPLLTTFINSYTTLKPEQLENNYFDLQINSQYSLQKDTSIAYTYDDDFNMMEEIQINEVSVPTITQAWKYNEVVEASLPNTFFYKFQKKQIDQYLISTTSDIFPAQAKPKQTLYPLYFSVNFEDWPDSWNISILKRLHEKKVKATLKAKREDIKTLIIDGRITYSK